MMSLQMFAEDPKPVAGKKLVYLFRVLKNAATKPGTLIAFTTENSRKKSKDADVTATKDGNIRTPGQAEVEISVTAILAKGDTTVQELEEAMDTDEIIEVWEANLDEKASAGDNKFKGRYYQGYLTEVELKSSAEDHVEVSLTFGINGTGKAGDVTVTTTQQKIADYVFKDTTAAGV